jgi:uncharacterized protein
MSRYTIIDRRKNPRGKNLTNRKRFLERTREWVRDQVRQRSGTRNITSNEGESIVIDQDDISEPSFDYDRSQGQWDRVLPGNRDFVPGDTITRPRGGSGRGGPDAGDLDDEDHFEFSITKEEYLNILFEDLELPDLVKDSHDAAVQWERKRAGYSTAGTPNNLDLVRSLKNSLGRRIALAFPLDKKIKEKQEEIERAEPERKLQLEEELKKLLSRRKAVAYIDPVDVRYRRFDRNPVPNAQAVVFCLMDVSGSMGEKEKETAKRFFLLLYLFLERKYQKVDIVFVRHTTHAEECTEQEFFYSKESGGTMVSSGVKEINRIIKERYSPDIWNIYCVQASDGDNFDSDNQDLRTELEELLPLCQYYVYNEVFQQNAYLMGSYDAHSTNVRELMEMLSIEYQNLEVVRIGSVDDVVPTFRSIFNKRDTK